MAEDIIMNVVQTARERNSPRPTFANPYSAVQASPIFANPYSAVQPSPLLTNGALVPYSDGQENDSESLCVRVKKLEEALGMLMDLVNERAKKEPISEEDLGQLKAKLSRPEASNLSTGAAAESVEMNMATISADSADGNELTTESKLNAVLKGLAEIQDWRARVEAKAQLDSQKFENKLAELSGRIDTALPASVPTGKDTSRQDDAKTVQKDLKEVGEEEGSGKEMPMEVRTAEMRESLPDRPIVWDVDVGYLFDASVYDAAIFVFSGHLGIINSAFIVIFFLLNVCLQSLLVVTVKSNFTGNPLPMHVIDRLKEWRASEGHAYYNADRLTGVSLVARVCAVDPGLSLSAAQAEIIDNANTYLHTGAFSAGKMLSNISILLWIFTCALEVRKSILCILAMCHVPRLTNHGSGIVADGEELQLIGLSSRRRLWACSVACCRCAVAILLVFYGSWWLASTIDVRELLLNASALGFVLEIDEMIFGVLSPMHVIGFMDSVKPLKLPSSMVTSVALPLALGICIILFMIRENIIHIERVSTHLKLARDALCSPSTDLDFIAGASEIDWLFYAKSVPYDESGTPEMKARRFAIQLRIDQDPRADRYAFDVTPESTRKAAGKVESFATMLTGQIATQACTDTNVSFIGPRLFIVTGDKEFETLESCAELKTYCIGAADSILARNVRMMCPITCGCADPMSGMWNLAQGSAGCPWENCQVALDNAVNEYGDNVYGCQDKSVTELEGLLGWSNMLHVLNESGMLRMLPDSLLYHLNRTGCKAFQSLTYVDKALLCGTYDFWGDVKILLGAGVMCPESCGCYYDYGADPIVPDGFELYTPGDRGICPTRSCWQRYYESALAAGVDLYDN